MQSTMIEFLRAGNPEEGTLVRDMTYLVTTGPTGPVRTLTMPLSYRDFRRFLSRLRYKASKPAKAKALEELSKIVTGILLSPSVPKGDVMQLDLVVTVAEIGALPFEAACNKDGAPLFVDSKRVAIPTRRVRGKFAEQREPWPTKPRVLFVHASPEWVGGPAVPAKEHKEALQQALQPWLEPLANIPQAAIPDEESVLVTLPEASLADIQQVCAKARKEGRPFTHVHILAHGVQFLEDELVPDDISFGIGLLSQHQKPATAKELAKALAPKGGAPIVVSLAVCDGGNQINSAFSGESVVQTLHRAGIPVVLGSQLPLTFPGSMVITKTFYRSLLEGEDIRIALYRTRVALYQEVSGAGHDWLSFVAYVRLPEGYAEQLPRTQLERELASLETANRWAKHIEENDIEAAVTLNYVSDALDQRIDWLTKSLGKIAADDKLGLREENTGLLGSANKRLARFRFVRARCDKAKRAEWLLKSREALLAARDWYLEGYQHNHSAHWNGAQYLSLQAILEGKIDLVWRWHAVLDVAAAAAKKNRKEFWALGTVAELYLLAPLAGEQPDLERAGQALRKMQQCVARYSTDKVFPIESMRRQLKSYTDWWTKENGFFKTRETDLAADAKLLLEVLDESI